MKRLKSEAGKRGRYDFGEECCWKAASNQRMQRRPRSQFLINPSVRHAAPLMRDVIPAPRNERV
jgi:hypothetical protein